MTVEMALESLPPALADAMLNAPAPPAAPERPPFVAGVFEDMPFNTYRAIEAMSQSGARKILKTPLHYVFDRDHPSEPTDSMQFGTAVHCGVLEPDAFQARVAAAPKVDKRTNAGKAAWAEFCLGSVGKVILSPDDFDRVRRCADAVHAHPAARELLAGATIETSLFWTDARYKVPSKGRLDIRNHGGIVDLKTTKDASPEEFAKSIANFGYDVQGAHYFSGCEHLLDATPEFFVIIAVESEEPHAVACYAMPSNGILAGAHKMNLALERYARALESGRWEGYPDTIETITLPRWATTFNR